MKYPIVILHGWGLSAKMFDMLARLLKKSGFDVRVPDFPGFGNARIPERPYVLDDYVDFLSQYLKKEHLEQPIIIGHSFGGRVALKFAARNAHLVHALILTGTPGFTPVSKKKLMLFVTIAKIGKLFFLIPFFHYFEEHARRWYYYVVGARDYYRAEGVMRETFKNIVKEELVSSMRAISVPTLLVWGEQDLITPVAIAHKMKKTIENSQLIFIPKVGHAVPFRQPKEFVSATAAWLKNV